ncbi:MAG: ABC transporter ATP-binding protein [Planctomycetes bacterium]|nr:ABC transporter ATP-binding protein [Planctomycetota bacterium]
MPAPSQIPEPVVQAIRSHAGSDSETTFGLQTDVRSDGSFGEEWLVLTPAGLYTVLREPDGASVRRHFPLHSIREVTAETMVGGGVLQITGPEGGVTQLMRYSGTQAKAFGEAARAVEIFVRSGRLEVEEELLHGQVCEQCGRRLPEGTKVCPNCLDKGKVLRRLMDYTRPYRRRTALMIAVLLVITGTQMLPPFIGGAIIDDVLSAGSQPADQRRMVLAAMVLILTFAHITRHALSIFKGRLAGWLGNHLTYDIRGEVFRSLQRLSLSFFDRNQTGAVMSRVNQDTSHLHGFLVHVLPFGVQSVLLILAIGAVLFVINWKITLFILVPVPFLIWSARMVWRRLHTYYSRYFERRSRLNATIGDSLWGIRVVKAFGQEGREIERFGMKNLDFREAGVVLEQKWALYMPVISFVTMSGTMIVWYTGGIDVMGGRMSVGELVWYMGNLAMFYGPVQMLTGITNYLSNALTSAERVFEILDTPSEVSEDDNAVDLGQLNGKIELRNVTFGYTRLKPVLDNISLTIDPGETVGLVGRSGSGKTTITNLICRFYDAQGGRVLLDGHDVGKIKKQCLGRNIAVVLQETFLFDGTIGENIAYGRPDVTPMEMMRAAKAANAHDFIVGFPHGYDSRVGERGGRLSLGERQRVAIARAILNDPRILILDEATSSVDTETERQIQGALDKLTKNRTTIIIAHRLSTLRNANRIIVVHEGRLAETGTHDELMSHRGNYYWLIKAQGPLEE